MKTTFDIPDALFRQVKARAALTGESLKRFVVGALQDKLRLDNDRLEEPGWRAVMGKAAPEIVGEVQRTIDAEFSSVDPKDWQ